MFGGRFFGTSFFGTSYFGGGLADLAPTPLGYEWALPSSRWLFEVGRR